MNVIQVSNVKKTYGHEFTLSEINLSVRGGKIFALLGPNGAGKTTLVKLILHLLHADEGSIELNGLNAIDPKSRIGVAFLPEKFSFFPYYTVRGVLEFFGTMKGLTGDTLKQQVDEALRELKIDDLQKRKLKTLSKGQQQRVGLASLLIGETKLLILDEPFSGLDPIGIRDLKEILKNLKNKGKTIFINSHILSEMEQICDDVAILNKGKVLFSGHLESILNQGQSLEDFFYKLVNS